MSNSDLDPLDEFEFKPLTDGLGFHKKVIRLKEGLQQSGVVADELQGTPDRIPSHLVEEEAPLEIEDTKKHTYDEILSALNKNRSEKIDLDFTEPLPRPEPQKSMEIEPERPVRSPFPRRDVYRSEIKKVPTRQELGNVGTRRGAADSPPRRLVPATLSIESAFLDLLIICALSLIFMLVLLSVTKVELDLVIKNLMSDTMTKISLGIMFVAVMQMYVVIARSFFGRTLGEWTFDLQVGRDDEQKKENYPLRVALRSLIVTCTGLIVLPLISACVGRDLAGRLSGIYLYRQNY